jgi:capsular exopolysaccharide synthesis family protein
MAITEHNFASEGPNRPTGSDQIDLLELMMSLKKRLLTIFVVTIAVFALVAFNTLRQRKTYQASASVIVTPSKGGQGNQVNLLEGVVATGAGTLKTQVQIISSLEMMREAFDVLTREEKIRGFGGEKTPLDFVNVRSVDDANLIEVQVKSYGPEEGAKYANAIIDTYLKKDLERNSQAIRQGREYVERERKATTEELSAAMSNLAEFKESSGFVSPSAQVAAITTKASELRSTLILTEKEVLAARLRAEDAKRRLKEAKTDVASQTTVSENPEFAQLRSQLAQLLLRQAEVAQTFVAESPERADIDRQVAEVKARMTSVPATTVTASTSQRNPILTDLERSYATATSDLISSKAKLDGVRGQLQLLDDQLNTFPELERQFSSFDQRVSVLKQTLDLLSSSYYSLLIQERSSQPNSIAAAKAVPASDPSSPNVRRDLVAGLILGLFCGILAGLTSNYFDNRLHRSIDVEDLTGLATLSLIPEVIVSHEQDGNLVVGKAEPIHAYLEAFRMLRNNLLLAKGGQIPRIIAVTSSVMGEGKSTIALNTAISLAMDRKKVVLVDVDLRRPTVHIKARVSKDFGLTNLIQGTMQLEQVLQPTEWQNLSALTSGPLPPNPAEFLNTPESATAINSLLDNFDFIVLDCPPCIGLSDMQVISRLCNGVSLVSALERATKQEILGALRMLRQAGAPILGGIINRVKPERGGYYAYYGYSSYGDDQDGNGTSSSGLSKKNGKRTKKD